MVFQSAALVFLRLREFSFGRVFAENPSDGIARLAARTFPAGGSSGVVIYTREECHLCDQAKDVLWAHRAWLPEIEEVDITGDPALMEQFSEQIPVVEIDGQVRFRGQVNEILLRRLIEATPPHSPH